ncbi:Uncharacterised protein [Achromobacter xylosoxidans]|nr:Uncharacterised protein [Achromobacter xylosoxidans]
MRDRLRHRQGVRQGLHRRGHDLAGAQQVEWIDPVFAADVVAAARDFLGQDGTAQQQYRDAVGEHAGGQHRQQRAQVAGQLDREQRGRQRRAHGAAHHRCHAHQRPEARRRLRQPRRGQRAQGAAEDQQGRQHPARGARTQRDRPDRHFHHQQQQHRLQRQVAGQQVADVVIAHAQRGRVDQAADADGQAAQGRPPHPVQRQFLEQVLGRVHQRRQHARAQPRQHPHGGARQQVPRRERHGAGVAEDRPGIQHEGARGGGHQRGGGHGQEAARFPFEQQQLHRQQHRGQRRGEDRRHARGRARHQQRLALAIIQVDGLRQQRADGAAGHDDGTLGAERAAGADGNGRRHRLEHRDLGRDAALAYQDGFHRLGNAVAADLLGSIAGHQADDEAADDGNQHRRRPEPAGGDGQVGERKQAVVGQVGAQRDQAQQGPGRGHAGQAGRHGQRHQQHDTFVGGEVAQPQGAGGRRNGRHDSRGKGRKRQAGREGDLRKIKYIV